MKAYLGCNIRHEWRFSRLRSYAPQTQHFACPSIPLPEQSGGNPGELELANFPLPLILSPPLFLQRDFLWLKDKPVLTADRARSTSLVLYGQTVHFLSWSAQVAYRSLVDAAVNHKRFLIAEPINSRIKIAYALKRKGACVYILTTTALQVKFI